MTQAKLLWDSSQNYRCWNVDNSTHDSQVHKRLSALLPTQSLIVYLRKKKKTHSHTPVLAFSLELQNQPIFPSISGSTALLFSVKCTLGYSIDCFHRNITPKKHFRLKLFPCEHKTTYPRARPHSIERFDDKRVVLTTVNVILCI